MRVFKAKYNRFIINIPLTINIQNHKIIIDFMKG